MNIPFRDLKASYRELRVDFDAFYQRVTESRLFVYPISERMAKEVLSLPMGPQLDELGLSRVISTTLQAGFV